MPDGTTLNNLYYGSGHLYNQSLTIQHSNTTGKDGQIIHELRHSQTNELHQEVLRQHGQSKTNQSHHTVFDYDPMGRLTQSHTSTHDHIIKQAFYHYDKKGQLTHLNTNTRLTSTHQSPNHLAKQVNYFNRTHQYTYDKLGRLTQHKLADHQHHTGHTESFAFDPASNRVPLPQTNTQTTHQGIDQRTKRPTSLISQGKLISYSYDVHGNVKTKTETPLNPKTNKPIYQSDNGLIGYRKSIQFAYHPNNELKQTITIKDTGQQVQRTTTQYHYDAFGRRIAKHSKTEQLNKLNQQGKLVKYPTTLLHLRKTDKTKHHSRLMLWDGNRQLQEYTDTHIFTTIYEQNSFEPVARIVGLATHLEQKRLADIAREINRFVRIGETDEVINQRIADNSKPLINIYHYHNNHLGTPQELTNEQGDVIWLSYDYAWGRQYDTFYKTQAIGNHPIAEHELQPIRFQGQMLDIETGLHYNRFRYYDSDVGMFIQRDPIGLLGGVNVYQYAPNPVGWVDPWGLAKFTVKVKNEVITENTKFFGKPTCENCGIDLVRPQKSVKGVTPPANEWQTDHIKADIKGGTNTEENGQLLCRKCNRDFSDKDKINLKVKNREDYTKSQSLKKKNPCTK